MAKLFMTIGLPASGKSTYCSERICKDTVYLSSDVLREKLLGDVNDQSKNGFIFNEMFKRTVSALKEGKNVYYDATNLNRKKRVNFLKQLPECEKICLMFCTPFYLCCERNSKRKRIVPKEVMERMYKSFQPPHRAEGFDMIVYISNSEDEKLKNWTRSFYGEQFWKYLKILHSADIAAI